MNKIDFDILSKIQVKNFRNIRSDIFTFKPGINCLFGDNGTGKTNLLEAIYYLYTAKSFRKNTSFSQLISVDSSEAQFSISGVFSGEQSNSNHYSCIVEKEKTSWFLNSKISKKKTLYKPVMINPFDSFKFYNQASERRSFFNDYLSVLDKDYKLNLSKLNKLLKQRNSLLSNRNRDLLQYKSIDINLAQIAENFLNIRKTLIDELNNYIPKIFRNIFSVEHNLQIKEDSIWVDSCDRKASKIFDFLQKNLSEEFIIGHTSKGFHRDDFVPYFDGFKAAEFCSLGQQKMSYLSLLFAYIDLFRYKFRVFPLVLLDDLSGELDWGRWKLLVDYLREQNFQVLISSANSKISEELDKLQDAHNIFIKDGALLKKF